MSEITTKNGLLLRDGEVIPLPEADAVAVKHGYVYAEQFVRDLERKQLAFFHSLRPEVRDFALLMELRLSDKDADKGQRYKEADIDNLQVSAASKVYQIDRAIQDGTGTNKHAIDLGNYAMMIAYVGGALVHAAVESCDSNGGAGSDQVKMS